MVTGDLETIERVLQIILNEQNKNQKLIDELDEEVKRYDKMDICERIAHDKKFYAAKGRHAQLNDILDAVKSTFFVKEFK